MPGFIQFAFFVAGSGKVISATGRMWCAALLLGLAVTIPVHAQVNPEIANCQELTDPDTKTQAELCSAHVGCKLVFAIHSTCVKARKFIDNLKESIGDGVATLFGRRKEVTSDAVFEASLSDVGRSASKSAEWQEKIKPIREAVGKAGSDTVSGKASDDGRWTFIGEVQDGKPNGPGTRYFSNGEVQRGTFKDGRPEGSLDTSFGSGQRSVSEYHDNKKNGYGLDVLSDGTEYKGTWADGQRNGPTETKYTDGRRFEGRYEAGAMAEGTFFRPDGSKLESGTYKSSQLEVGQRFDEQGAVQAEVNKPRDRMLANQARQDAEQERLRREQEARVAAEQRRRDADAATAQAFKDSLGAMNAGQLFAKADELSVLGDRAKAREALRALVSRFPDHALAATAAQQMTGSGNLGAQEPRAAQRAPATGSAGGSSRFSSVCMRNLDKVNNALLASGALQYGATGDQFLSRTYELTARLMEPCIASDPRAAERHQDARQNLEEARRFCAASKRSFQCTEWGSEANKNQAWFNTFAREVNRALGDPNYSADLGSAGKSSASGNAAGGSSGASGTCDAVLAALEREHAQANQRPLPDGATPGLMRVMWMTKRVMDAIDRSCPGDARHTATRRDMERSYRSAETACGQLSSSGACRPNSY